MTLNTNDCTNEVCLVIFPDLMDKTTGSYEITVVASNQFIKVYTSSITISKNNDVCECMLPKLILVLLLFCSVKYYGYHRKKWM